ncbi:MAG TPA: LPS assembly lipoprotein LptE [Roseomonas sp.]|jgi:LPS-assembly lipoprotein
MADARTGKARSPVARRHLFALGAALALPGCGFRPLYATGGGTNPDAQTELSAVRVALVGERNGQILRRALQQRLQSEGVPARYDLHTAISFGTDVQGYRQDGTPSRVRYTATANWQLFTLDTPPRPLTRGTERAFDAYNIPENQFFASDISSEASMRRMMDQLAEDMTRRLAVWFSTGRPADAQG